MRAMRRLEMLQHGMMPIPIGLETAPREVLDKLGIHGVQYSAVYNERYIPIVQHNHE